MEATSCRLLLNLLLLLLLARGAFSEGAADTLGIGGNITGDETLVSAGGTFTMGFFSLGVPTRYYLGIWFSVSGTGSNFAACWVANSERPLPDKAGALVVSDMGSLVLRDGSGQIAWSSNTTTASSSVVVQLLDSGNLVVRDQGSGMVLWQSFDHPSNTLLSGMKVGKDFWNGAEWYLRSWCSADDPSPGPYRRVLDITSGVLVDFVVLKDNVTTYRAGPWNGRFFSGIPDVEGYADLVTLSVTISPDEISYRYTSVPGSNLTRLVVMDNGEIKRFVWNGQIWSKFFSGNTNPCDEYGKCGSFGLCDRSAQLSLDCRCLRGFISPASPSAGANSGMDCQRKVPLQCTRDGGTTDGFVLVKGVKLPDTHNASVNMSITMKECRRRCRANCSCLAYAAADIRGGSFPSGCVMWTNIFDLRLQGQQDLYLRLAKSELDKNFPLAAVVAPVASTIAALALFLLIWWIKNRPRGRGLNLRTIRRATGNFSESHVIGNGGFAIVYKVELPDGRTFAVKRLKQSVLTPEGESAFRREVEMMDDVRHGNILRLLGYCHKGRERILIYPFMPNKSLDLYIFGEPSHRARLNWRQRLDIILGVARGVEYLHQGIEDSVVHRDLKPSNVLLDNNWKPKIADFNTAKLFIEDQPQSEQTLYFTPGYAPPEYFQGEVALKCDVYSFGVTLLETLSGHQNGKREVVISHARKFWQQGRAMALVDSMVPLPPPDSEIRIELERCIQIGLICVQEAPENRRDMTAVVAMLTYRTTDINLPPPDAQENEAAVA